MAEPVVIGSTSPQTHEVHFNRGRWLRLLRGVLWFGGFIASISFAGDCFLNLWDHTLA